MVTQKDIAQRLGISVRAVGFALNGTGRLSDDLRERIVEESKTLGYRPNPLARALVTGKTGLISVWVPNLAFQFGTRVLQVLQRELDEGPFQTLVLSGENVERAAQSLLKWRVDGRILLDAPLELSERMARDGAATPTLLLDCYSPRPHQTLDCINIDKEQAALDAMNFLQARTSRIALVRAQSPEARFDSQFDARSRVYEREMKRAGLQPEIIEIEELARGEFRRSAHQAMARYLECQASPSGLFCFNDDIALGVARALREKQYRIGEDVHLVGCDGLEDMQDVLPALSTIALPLEELASQAWTMLCERIGNPELERQTHSLHATFVAR